MRVPSTILSKCWTGLGISLLLFLSVSALAEDETDPNVIFQKMFARYQALETYSGEGVITSESTSERGTRRTERTFSIKLKKPNQYLITFKQTSTSETGVAYKTKQGAVWSDGTQRLLYLGPDNYFRAPTDERAISMAVMFGGSDQIIAALFFPSLASLNVPLRMNALVLEKAEAINGEDCYVISGLIEHGARRTVWISKSSFSFIQTGFTATSSPGTVTTYRSDDLLDMLSKQRGFPVGEASRQKMREILQQEDAAIDKGQSTSVTTQTYTPIASPDFTDADLSYTPPAGAVIRDSLIIRMSSAESKPGLPPSLPSTP